MKRKIKKTKKVKAAEVVTNNDVAIDSRYGELTDKESGFVPTPIRNDRGSVSDEQIRNAIINPDNGNHLG